MTIFTKTPLRLSFFGGGSDYAEYFNHNESAVLGGTLDKYIYIYQLPMSNFSPKKYKLSWRHTEEVDNICDFKHPVIRAVLEKYNWDIPINISTMSDIPGGTGLGSSSSFTVGFLKLINSIIDNDIDKLSLAREAYNVEHDILKENVGIQDQLHASFGGFNLFRISGRKVTIEPIQLKKSFRNLLNRSLILVYTGVTRHASEVLNDQIQNTKKELNFNQIDELVQMTIEAAELMQTSKDDKLLIKEIGSMLHDAWKLKKTFSKKITNSKIDEIYEDGINLGAYGGKLCGAGGGGFVMFLVKDKAKKKFIDFFGKNNVLDISLTNNGSEIVKTI